MIIQPLEQHETYFPFRHNQSINVLPSTELQKAVQRKVHQLRDICLALHLCIIHNDEIMHISFTNWKVNDINLIAKKRNESKRYGPNCIKSFETNKYHYLRFPVEKCYVPSLHWNYRDSSGRREVLFFRVILLALHNGHSVDNVQVWG